MIGMGAGRGPKFSLRNRRRSLLFLVAGLGLALILSGSCAEWDKYWDSSPTRPARIIDTTPPTVRLVSPSGPDSARATPVTGAAYSIVINATDDVGVARVALHVDEGPSVEVSGPPWEIGWDTTPLAEGSHHRLWATAADAAGNVGASDTAWAQVFNSGPQVVVSEPGDGAYVLGAIQVTAQFVGPVPEMEKVEFLVGAESVGTRTSPPWSITLDTQTLTAGQHFVTARATTTTGHVGVSPPIRIRVNNGRPSVAVSFPPDWHRVATRGTLVLSAAATDPVEGTIPAPRVTWRSNMDGVVGRGGYARVSNLSVGIQTITVTAVNAWGTADSVSIPIQVMPRPTYTFCANVFQEMFQSSCISCHTPESSEFNNSLLDLRTYGGLRAGGITTRYESVVPCRPESSLVYNKVAEEIPWVGAPMPPRDQFPAVPLAIQKKMRIWILEGAAPDEQPTCAP